jgi:hypothetical protein
MRPHPIALVDKVGVNATWFTLLQALEPASDKVGLRVPRNRFQVVVVEVLQPDRSRILVS